MTKSADRYISLTAIRQIQAVCNPLKSKGIIEFTHDISFSNGEISILSTNEAVFRHWFKHRTPAIRTDENGRTLDAGIYLVSLLEEMYYDCAQIAPIFNSLCKAKQSVAILEKDHDCQHLYSFSFNQTGKEFLHWLINHVSQLENFIEYYKNSVNEIISEAKKPANRIVIPFIKENPDKEDSVSNLNTEKIMQKVIHKDSKIPLYLSKQQSICLMFLMQGKSAKETAFAMNLSPRTVQHYMARIKKMLGCATNKELIIFYGNQVYSEAWEMMRKLFE